MADLSHFALVRAAGPDAEGFLQGQLSNDIRQVSATRSQLSAYCNPKGRMLAVFLIARRNEDYCLQLPGSLAEGTLKRLRMFILRAKVTLEPVDPGLVLAGLSGPGAEKLVREALGAVPQNPYDCLTIDPVTVIRLPGPHPRFELMAPVERMPALWQQFVSGHARPVGAGPWTWLDIQAAIPIVLPGTVEEFVPQMANLDAVNGVSFTKGCYPGQEIVARMHYLGRLKQRMVLAHVDIDSPPTPGTPLYSPDLPGQSAGSVVAAEPSPTGGCDLLAVAQLTSIEANEIHLADINGPVLNVSPLPYHLPIG